MTESNSKISVSISPEPFVGMILHAAQNSMNPVHGFLVGSIEEDHVVITRAIPVCHETPTAPLLETAWGLVHATISERVVGWYTAPERLGDTHPGPVALRIAANFFATKSPSTLPVLLVMNNEALSDCIQGERQNSIMKVFGKDSGGQWLEPLSLQVLEESKSLSAVNSAFAKQIGIVDFVNHLESEDNPEWIYNEYLTNHVNKVIK
jgi:Uncharacterised protein family (UPF0172)